MTISIKAGGNLFFEKLRKKEQRLNDIITQEKYPYHAVLYKIFNAQNALGMHKSEVYEYLGSMSS